MVLYYLQRRAAKIILLSFVAVKALEADSRFTYLECDDFRDMESTTCNCSVAVETEDTINNCDSAWSTAYITAGDQQDDIDESSFHGENGVVCLCCYQDLLTGELLDTATSLSGTTCTSVIQNQGSRVLGATFVANKSLLAGTTISCIVPCLSGKNHVTVSFVEGVDGIRMAETGVSVMMIVAVVATFGVIILLVPPLTFLFIKYQRKWAWVMSENKPTRPPPLPTVQNSGLIYIVDPKGLILPLGDVEEERPEASGTVQFGANPLSTPYSPKVSTTKNVVTKKRSKASTVSIKTAAQGTKPEAPGTKPEAPGTKPAAPGTKPEPQERNPEAQSPKPNHKNVTDKTGEDNMDVDFKEVGLLPTMLNTMKKYSVDPSERFDTSTMESTDAEA